MRQTITVDSTAIIESVSAEIYTSYADLRSQFERTVDEAVGLAKSELDRTTSQLLEKLESAIDRIVEDKVDKWLRSDDAMEAVAQAVRLRLAPDMTVNKKPWWKWW
jgi:hypothetical protein